MQYHTARFRLVSPLAKALTVATPPVRKPGTLWIELPRLPRDGHRTDGACADRLRPRLTGRQSLDTQLDALKAAGVARVFAEKISTRALVRPELERAVALAAEMRASGLAVTLVVHEHKRLGRGLDLAALAEHLRAAGIGLQFLSGELQGSHDPATARVDLEVFYGWGNRPQPGRRLPNYRDKSLHDGFGWSLF